MTKTYYLAGPMRGHPEFNFPAFHEAASLLRSTFDHFKIVSPAEHDEEVIKARTGKFVSEFPGYVEGDMATWAKAIGGVWTFEEAITWDLQQVLEADGIVLLPGWEASTGAGHEKYVAEACGKEVIYYRPGELPSIVDPAAPLIVGLMGYAQVGKDTVADIMVKEHGFERIAFADALKSVLYNLTPLTRYADVMGDVNRLGWEGAKAEGTPTDHYSVRKYLQRLGVAVREHIDEDAWVNAAMRNVQPGGRYVFTDVRFPNEAGRIKDMGGKLWRIERLGTGPVNNHVSETALDGWESDLTIHNNADLAVLGAMVHGCVQESDS